MVGIQSAFVEWMNGWMDAWMMNGWLSLLCYWMNIDLSFWDFRVLSRTSSFRPSLRHRGDGSLGIVGRENEDYPENIAMKSMNMASVPGASGNGYGKHLLRWGSYPGKKVKISGLRGAVIKSSRKRKISLFLALQILTLQRLNIDSLEKISIIIPCQSSLIRCYEKWDPAHPVPIWGDWCSDLAY